MTLYTSVYASHDFDAIHSIGSSSQVRCSREETKTIVILCYVEMAGTLCITIVIVCIYVFFHSDETISLYIPNRFLLFYYISSQSSYLFYFFILHP